MCSHLLIMTLNHPVNRTLPCASSRHWLAFFSFLQCSSESSISRGRSLPTLAPYVFWFLSVLSPVYGLGDPLRTKVKPELPKAQKARYYFLAILHAKDPAELRASV